MSGCVVASEICGGFHQVWLVGLCSMYGSQYGLVMSQRMLGWIWALVLGKWYGLGPSQSLP